MKKGEDEYTTVRLPKELMEIIDNIIKSGVGSYKSRAEFIKEALRRRFEELKVLTPTPEPPKLEHFNISEHGVRILDRTLTNGYSRGRIIDGILRARKHEDSIINIQSVIRSLVDWHLHLVRCESFCI